MLFGLGTEVGHMVGKQAGGRGREKAVEKE